MAVRLLKVFALTGMVTQGRTLSHHICNVYVCTVSPVVLVPREDVFGCTCQAEGVSGICASPFLQGETEEGDKSHSILQWQHSQIDFDS